MPCEWRIWNYVVALSGRTWRHIHCLCVSATFCVGFHAGSSLHVSCNENYRHLPIISGQHLVKLYGIPETTAQTPRKLTTCISGNEFMFIAMGVFCSFSRHKLLKDKFTWKFQYILSLDYKRPKSDPNSPVSPYLTKRHWRHVQQSEATPVNVWAVHEATSLHMRCRGAKQKLMVRNFCFWRPYIVLCVDILCIVHKWNISVWRWEMKHSGRLSGFLENGMQKPKLET
jgi:hypothetical protein